MVSLPSLSIIALMISSGVIAAPWNPTSRHHTHRARGVGPTGVQLKSYHPPSTFKGYGVNGMDHAMAKRGVKRAAPEEAASSFLQSKLGVSSDGLKRHSGYTFDDVSYEYFTQIINGLPVSNAVANAALKGDKVMSYGASFIKPNNIASAVPLLLNTEAISKAESALGGKYNGWPTTLSYFATDSDHVVLVHVVQIQDMRSGDWKQAYVDANNGKMVNIVDFVADHSYNALPIVKQDPTEGFEVIKDPEDTAASPSGWHESKGVKTTETSGNNVVTYKGLDQNAAPISIPIVDPLFEPVLEPSKPIISSTTVQSSPDNNYNYTYDASKAPAKDPNVDAARVNTFYVVNKMHDLTYKYGFTEAAFNFQNDNFGKGGVDNDRVQVSIQDPSGTNNANFATPPDGQSGQMRMYTWTYTTPQRDGALENDIVTHEMTHGISNRMTGGGTGECLQTTEAGGMGEGWSDAMADMLEAKSDPLDNFTLGSYVVDNPAGIRSHPYSTNMDTNPLTYATVGTQNEVHNIGEVWATMIHEVLASLITQYGLASPSDISDPTKPLGQNIALHMILGGFALQPCNPTFVSARDGIIQADANKFGGANKCLLWKAFAKRGLGKDAQVGVYTDSMTVPEDC